VPAAEAGRLAAALAGALPGRQVEVAWPGVWVGPRAWACHGHLLDLHLAIPTFERLAAGAMERWLGPLPRPAAAEDYERVLGPLYALLYEVGQGARPDDGTRAADSTIRTWTRLAGRDGGGLGRVRSGALMAGFTTAVALLRRAGVRPLTADVRGPALRRASLRAMGEVVARLRVPADHVIFGHSHRFGPLPGDDPAEWLAPGGARLHNCGSWVHQPHFLSADPGESPYWPGGAQVVEGDGPPRGLRLLAGCDHRALRAAAGAAATPRAARPPARA
jgi:hypothetical protein